MLVNDRELCYHRLRSVRTLKPSPGKPQSEIGVDGSPVRLLKTPDQVRRLIPLLHCRKLIRKLLIRIMIMMCTLRLVFNLLGRADETVKLNDHDCTAVGEQWRVSDWEGKEVRERMTVQEGEFGCKII
jgi:hypothetical protein